MREILKNLSLASLLIAPSLGVAEIYGLKNASSATGSSATTNLFTVDTSTDTITSYISIDYLGSSAYVDALAMNKAGDLYAFVNTNLSFSPTSGTAQLVSLSPSGVATAIGTPINNMSIFGAGFDFTNRLWAIDLVGSLLVEIDPTAGTVLQTVPLDRQYVDITFATDNRAYASFGGSIYQLDLTTGNGTLVYSSTITGSNYDGIAFTGNMIAYLEEGNYADELRKAEGAAFANETIITTNLSGLTGVANSGRMDLAGLPNAVTAEDDSYINNTALVIAPDSSANDISIILNNDSQLLEGALTEIIGLDATNTAVTSTQGGTIAISGTTVSYTPPANFTGIDTFTYQVCIPSGSCNTATVTLSVTNTPTALGKVAKIPSLGLLGLVSLLAIILSAGLFTKNRKK